MAPQAMAMAFCQVESGTSKSVHGGSAGGGGGDRGDGSAGGMPGNVGVTGGACGWGNVGGDNGGGMHAQQAMPGWDVFTVGGGSRTSVVLYDL